MVGRGAEEFGLRVNEFLINQRQAIRSVAASSSGVRNGELV
jgi:hypothetical protein